MATENSIDIANGVEMTGFRLPKLVRKETRGLVKWCIRVLFKTFRESRA
jgi:hypothetical protein